MPAPPTSANPNPPPDGTPHPAQSGNKPGTATPPHNPAATPQPSLNPPPSPLTDLSSSSIDPSSSFIHPSSSPPTPSRNRNITFDLLRLLFAVLVLLAHAPEITDADDHRELLVRLGLPITFGTLAVDGFFLLSGYLIVRSWLGAPSLLPFLQKRILRIVPGYLTAAAISVLLVGLAAPAAPGFFAHLFSLHFFASIALLSAPLTPPVFPHIAHAGVNGALWTIAYEFRCYLLVALLGVTGLLRRLPWLLLTLAVLAIRTSLALQTALLFHAHYLLPGDPKFLYRLTLPFLLGGCVALFPRLPFRPILAAFAAAIAGAAAWLPVFRHPTLDLGETGIVLGGGYLLFYLGRLRWQAPKILHRLPDLSYGVYLYGWPIQCLWINAVLAHPHPTHPSSFLPSLLHSLPPGLLPNIASPWLTFALTLPPTLLAGLLSWHLIERPALALRRRPTAPTAGTHPTHEQTGPL